MTIEEAIAHCYEVAEGKTEQGKCESCAHEHAQLAMWLEELVAYRKLISRKNDPLTLDELREMDGEPVWVETPDKNDCCNGLSTVELAAPWKPGGLKPHVLIVSKNGDRNYAELLMVGFGGKIYRCKPKEETV